MKIYHCSPTLFDMPQIHDRQVRPDFNNNGCIGIWTDRRKVPYLLGFGPYLYELQIKQTAKEEKILLSELRRMSGSYDCDYVEFRKRKLAEGSQYLSVVEEQGELQVILLSTGIIESCTRIEVPPEWKGLKGITPVSPLRDPTASKRGVEGKRA